MVCEVMEGVVEDVVEKEDMGNRCAPPRGRRQTHAEANPQSRDSASVPYPFRVGARFEWLERRFFCSAAVADIGVEENE
jgi:hypothetical protein